MEKLVKYKSHQFLVKCHSEVESKFWQDFSSGDWEPSYLDFMTQHAKGGYFLDIGSWIGPISILMSYYYEKVISVDFDTKANISFHENVALNNIKNIEHHALGLSNTNQQMEIDADSLGDSTTSLFTNNSTKKLKVSLVRFPEFIKSLKGNEKISFIKMDCEGAEYLILDELYKYVKKTKISALISYHPFVLKKPKYYFVKIYHWFRQLAFRRYYFTKDGIVVKEPYVPLFVMVDRFPMADVIAG